MEINVFAVLLAGLGTFLSPCIIPLVPSYLAYISGIALGEKKKFTVVSNSLSFIIGFGTAFTILQILVVKFTNIASKLLGNSILNIIFGGIVIFMGLSMLGVFKTNKLYVEHRLNPTFKKKNIFTSYIFGFAFGFGWTPCMGPILFTLMSFLANNSTLTQGIFYIWIYTIGIGIPFLLYSLLLDNPKFIKLSKKLILPEKISGIILIVFGIILALDKMTIFLGY